MKKLWLMLGCILVVYPAFSFADWILWSVSGLSFFYTPECDRELTACRILLMDHSFSRFILTAIFLVLSVGCFIQHSEANQN